MGLLSFFLALGFALLLCFRLTFVAFALAGVGEIFGFQTLVFLLGHPGVELLLKAGFDLCHGGIGGEVLGFEGVGLKVVEFFGWAIEEVSDAGSQRGVTFCVGLPGFDGLTFVEAADGVSKFGCEIADELIAGVAYCPDGIGTDGAICANGCVLCEDVIAEGG